MKLKDKLTFGKYKGEELQSVIHNDVSYIKWCLSEHIFPLTEEVEKYINQILKLRGQCCITEDTVIRGNIHSTGLMPPTVFIDDDEGNAGYFQWSFEEDDWVDA